MSWFSILSFAQPSGPTVPIGVLVFDPDREQLLVRCRQDWDRVAERDDAEVLSAVCEDLVELGRNLGGAKLLAYLEDTLSHCLRVSDRERIEARDQDDALDTLYSQYVEGNTTH